MKEWMDLYDCQGRVKGLVHTTTQAPQDGNFYLATRIWVRDAAGAFLLLQCADTDSWTPGQWTVPGDFVAAGVQGPDAGSTGTANADRSHPGRYLSGRASAPIALSGQPSTAVPYHAIAQLYLVQLTETAPANVVLGEAVQTCQWVPLEDMGTFLSDHSLEPFTRLSYRQYSHRLLP